MLLYSDRSTALLSAGASGAGRTYDAKMVLPYGYLVVYSPTPSAIVKLQGSHDATGWSDIAIYTAVATSGTAQTSGYFPYLRGVTHLVYSGGGNTGAGWLYFAGGIG